jgi:thioredoxin reductase (NADPH)
LTDTVAIVGGGPTGIACAIELDRRGIAAVCYERGAPLESIYHFPEEMRWYSTRDRLDIADVPFLTPEAHPTRLEALAYYRGVAEKFDVNIVPDTAIESIRPNPTGGLTVFPESSARAPFAAPAAILATGFFHNPLRLRVPGDDLPHVLTRFVSSYPFHGRDVAVVGGRNGASEAALDLYRHGARVTLIVRAAAISDRVKYWIKPDLENRIRDGKIRALFESCVLEITPEAVRVQTPAGERIVKASAVFSLIGYEPDFALFQRCGIHLTGEKKVPEHDPETLESNVPNLYLAGAILGGREVGHIFIENSRHHAGLVASAIARRLEPALSPPKERS